MKRQAPDRVRRVSVTDPIAAARRYDYADAFEVEVAEPNPRSAEEFARLAIESAPRAVRLTIETAWRRLLKFQPDTRPSPDRILGAKIVTSEHDVVKLEASGPMIRGVIIGRRVSPTRVVLTTYVFYRRPVAARLVWAVAAPLHRTIALYLLKHAATLARAPAARRVSA